MFTRQTTSLSIFTKIFIFVVAFISVTVMTGIVSVLQTNAQSLGSGSIFPGGIVPASANNTSSGESNNGNNGNNGNNVTNVTNGSGNSPVTYNSRLTRVYTNPSVSVRDGDLIKTSNSPDIYIVRIRNGEYYIRLILNPDIFNSYGHLSWENVKTVSQSQMNQYIISDLVREVYSNGSIVPPGNIYKVFPQGDTGVKRLLRMTQAEFEGLFDIDSVYSINHLEAGPTFYRRGADLTVLDFGSQETPSFDYSRNDPFNVPLPPPPLLPSELMITTDEEAPSLSEDAPTVSPENGEEGVIEASLYTSDLVDTLTQNEEGRIFSAELEAIDSDIIIRRVDIGISGLGIGKEVNSTSPCETHFTNDAGTEGQNSDACEDKDSRPHRTFKGLKLIFDGDVVFENTDLDSSDFDFVDGSSIREEPYRLYNEMASYYRFRISSLDLEIEEGTEERMEVVLITHESLRDDRINNKWAVFLGPESVRGEDEAGLSQYAGGGSVKRDYGEYDGTLMTGQGNNPTFEVSGIARSFVITKEQAGLEASISDTEVENIARVSDSSDTSDITIAHFKFQNREDSPSATLIDVEFDIEGTDTTDGLTSSEIGDLVRRASLYEGNTRIATEDVTQGRGIEFEDVDIEFSPDEDVTFTLKIDINELDDEWEGKSIRAKLAEFDYEYGSDEDSATWDTMLEGPSVTLYASSPIVTAQDTPTFVAYENLVNEGKGVFKIRVRAVGGDIFIGNKCDDETTTGNTIGTNPVGASDHIGFEFMVEDGVTTGNKRWHVNGAGECTITSTSNATEVDSSVGTSNKVYRISSGSTASFTIELTVTSTAEATSNKNVRVALKNLWWKSDNDDTTDTLSSLDVSGLDIESPQARLSKNPS